MKIIQINSVYGYGSTGTIVKLISNEIKAFGGESYIACQSGVGLDENCFIINTKIGLKYNILKTRLFGNHGFHNKAATKKLLKWIDKIGPDIIHLQNIHGHYVNVELLFNYISKNNVKVIWTLHDCWPFTGHCAHFALGQCEKWKTGCFKCENLQSYPTTYILDTSKSCWKKKKEVFNQIPKKNMAFASTSDWVKGIQQKSFLSTYDCVTINNGIDLEIFYPNFDRELRADVCSEEDFLVFGFANKWLLDANAETVTFLDKALPRNIKILLIGTATLPEGLSKERFKALPFINDAELLAKYYSISDVFVNLTHEDTFPTVNIESLACGTPVITNAVCGSAEIIDKNTGFAVEENDNDTLLKAIMEVYHNGKSVYSPKCVERARTCYDKKHNYKKYIDLYGRVINS